MSKNGGGRHKNRIHARSTANPRFWNEGQPSKRSPRGRDRLEARCWCDGHYVKVDAADIARGLTGACSQPHCITLDIRNRARAERGMPLVRP